MLVTGDEELGESAQRLLREIFEELDKCGGEFEGWLLPDESTSHVSKAELEDCGLIELDSHGFGIRPTLAAIRMWRRQKKEEQASPPSAFPGVDARQEHLEAAKDVFQQLAARYLRTFEARHTLQAKRIGMGALRACLDTLARRGLVKDRGDNFIISDLGIEVAMGEADIDQELGLTPRPTPPYPTHGIVIQGNVAALNTAPGGTAIGTINVNGAMHELVEVHRELGEVSEQLWKILIRLSDVEANQKSGEDLKAAVDDLQVRAFVEELGGEKRKAALQVLTKLAPPILGLLGLPAA